MSNNIHWISNSDDDLLFDQVSVHWFSFLQCQLFDFYFHWDIQLTCLLISDRHHQHC